MYAACYRVAYRFIRLSWFVRRSRTFGARCIVICGPHILLIRQTYGDRRWTLPWGRLTKLDFIPLRGITNRVGYALEERAREFYHFLSESRPGKMASAP